MNADGMSYSEFTKATRKLTVFAQDPMAKINGKILTAQIVIPAEILDSEPTGFCVKVIDYDSTLDRFESGLKGVQGAGALENEHRETISEYQLR